MPVIASFNGKRELEADAVQQIGRPRPKGHDALLGIECAFVGFHSPILAASMQRLGVTCDNDAAQFGKAFGIGARYAKRTADTGCFGPEHCVRENRIERRLESLRTCGVESL